MMTERQRRAEDRIERAKDKKAHRFLMFAKKVAIRRLKDPEDAGSLLWGFCCRPKSLEMQREEFLSKGIQLIGGTVVLFDRGVLSKLLPSWGCSNRGHPALLMAARIREDYQESGLRSYSDRPDATLSSGTSGSSHNWV